MDPGEILGLIVGFVLHRSKENNFLNRFLHNSKNNRYLL